MPINLPDPPPRIARLHVSDRGYPVPAFVAWMKDGKLCPVGEGEPDFRVIRPGFMADAYNNDRCWICGGDLKGSARVFALGPMCVITHTTSEPPSHRECAEYAAKACPFLTNPREKRDMKAMPDNAIEAAGVHLDRNPGVVALYQSGKPKVFRAPGGVLFKVGAPIRVDWWARGRTATREEILDSIASGLPNLTKLAEEEGPEAVMELGRMSAEAFKLLPAA